ncbi:MAG: hypothetical protein LQ348_005122 [Seirophora lacunosa]|nr:MAG: hypothetical protein LQ348_005122 [Seirophora lacunosa]
MALPITPKGREAIKHGEQCVPRSSPTRAMLAKTALTQSHIDNLPAESGTNYNWKASQARWDRHLNLPSRRETREDCWNSRYLNSLKRGRTATISSRNLVNFAGEALCQQDIVQEVYGDELCTETMYKSG